MSQYLSLRKCLFVFMIYVSGVSSSFAQFTQWTNEAQFTQWTTECDGNWQPDRTKVTKLQWMAFHHNEEIWPPLTINELVFVYTNGSTCWPNGGYYYHGQGQVFYQGATASCKSNSPPDIVSQCTPSAPPPAQAAP